MNPDPETIPGPAARPAHDGSVPADHTVYRGAALNAATWWAQAALDELPTSLLPPGSTDEAMTFAGYLADHLRASQARPTGGQIRGFIKELSALVAADLAADAERRADLPAEAGRTAMTFIVNGYGHDRLLEKAAAAAGICVELFPLQTVMHIYRHRVQVARGTGSRYTTIWPLLAAPPQPAACNTPGHPRP
jgi:hypothetical protein